MDQIPRNAPRYLHWYTHNELPGLWRLPLLDYGRPERRLE